MGRYIIPFHRAISSGILYDDAGAYMHMARVSVKSSFSSLGPVQSPSFPMIIESDGLVIFQAKED